jgi:hypothetical protein
VDVVHNRGENLTRLRNLNAAAEYPIDPDNVVIRTQAQADASRPIPITNGGATINGQRLTGIARNVIVSENEGKSRYYAMSLNYQKTRGSDDYSYRLIIRCLLEKTIRTELTSDLQMVITMQMNGALCK